MNHFTRGFADELTKIAIDPMTAAGLVVAGKLTGANLLARYGHKIPIVRKLGQGIAGAGARAGMKGRPMIGRKMREALAIGGDAKLVKLYEDAHSVGRGMRKVNIGSKGARKALDVAEAVAKNRGMKGAAEGLSLAKGVDLEGKSRAARALDYGHKPVGEVASDISRGAKKALQRKHRPRRMDTTRLSTVHAR